MKVSEAFPSSYLKADDLQDRDVAVVIASWEYEQVGDDPKKKVILSFQGKQRKMICNKTNCNRIAYLYGDEMDGWIGKEIVLTSEFVEFQGQSRKGLRVKPPNKRQVVTEQRQGYKLSSTQPVPAPQPQPDDDLSEEIPF